MIEESNSSESATSIWIIILISGPTFKEQLKACCFPTCCIYLKNRNHELFYYYSTSLQLYYSYSTILAIYMLMVIHAPIKICNGSHAWGLYLACIADVDHVGCLHAG